MVRSEWHVVLLGVLCRCCCGCPCLPICICGAAFNRWSESSTLMPWSPICKSEPDTAVLGRTVHSPGSLWPLPDRRLLLMLLHTACQVCCRCASAIPCKHKSAEQIDALTWLASYQWLRSSRHACRLELIPLPAAAVPELPSSSARCSTCLRPR